MSKSIFVKVSLMFVTSFLDIYENALRHQKKCENKNFMSFYPYFQYWGGKC